MKHSAVIDRRTIRRGGALPDVAMEASQFAHRSRHRRSLGVVAQIALALLLGASCGCGADTATTDPTSTTGTTPVATDPPQTSASTSSTTTAPTGDEAEVRAVIDRYWPAFLAATMDPDPENPELKAILQSDAAIRILGAIEDLRNNGQRVVQPDPSVFAHEITSVTFDGPDRAVVKECVIDDLQIVVTATGQIVNGAVTTSEYTSTVVRDEGVWRISTSEQTTRLEGVHDCTALQ